MLQLSLVCLFCAILICLPLAAIFTFTTTPSVDSYAAAIASSLPPAPVGNNSFTTRKNPEPILLPPTQTITIIKNRTAAATSTPPPTPATQLTGDDISLLKLASRVDQSPKPVKKLAFMFLTASPLPLAPLWELYFSRASKNLYNIYVHADPGVNYTTPFLGVFAGRVIPSKPTLRHTPTLISAARRLLAHALLHDESNSMFALLSPSCIPIHSFNYTYRVLSASRLSFVEILKNEPFAHWRWAARGENAMLPEVEFEDFRVGSQFWVVTRRDARIIVADTWLWSKFKLPCIRDATCYPEEHYFPTLLSMVDPRGCVPCTLTHVSWKDGNDGHPRIYNGSEVGPDLILALRGRRPRYGYRESDGSNSSVSVKARRDNFLFARKFAPASLHNLISIANDVIFKD
ncbi:hypothetical protein CASFOL_007102 [Castilleja foliolosa]|uniref:Core-2/I-branching beta-1,6-N-acetylglucosaminyltransferase family protein n=1 Tax=Castilleja foliolosa TaxID=1961234 RepID=A0ABD3E966_9LAMI